MIAEGVAGSQEAFVQRMNETAQRLGMTRTNFANVNGLPDERQVTTARDLAKLARETLGVPPATNFNQKGVWRCPSVRWSDPLLVGYAANADVPSSYGYNDDRFSGNGARDYTNKFGLQGHYIPDTSVPKPLDLATASFTPIAESEVAVPSDMMAIGDGFEGNALFMRRPIEAFAGDGNIRTRHQGRDNVVFCDGHVESPTLKFLFEDDSDHALVRWNRDHQAHRGK
jgi:prepilin-type processing-associated H-X9-DG protein